MLFPTLGPISLPVVVAQPDERHVNRIASVLEWYDRHRVCNIWSKQRRITVFNTEDKAAFGYNHSCGTLASYININGSQFRITTSSCENNYVCSCQLLQL